MTACANSPIAFRRARCVAGCVSFFAPLQKLLKQLLGLLVSSRLASRDRREERLTSLFYVREDHQ
jgi:hypothetical protein